jgi:hypothetical protein
MARGWESKSVESQQESAAAVRSTPSQGDDPQARLRQQERGDLELSRTRILRELAAAVHPRHREQLEAALRYLDSKIAEINSRKSS